MYQEKIIKGLIEIVGENWISNDPAILVCYSRDQSLEISGSPDIVVLPKDTEEVSRVLRFANNNKVPVVPWSTGVNSAGGCIPQCGGIILDLKRMDKILEIDEINMVARIQPGVCFGRIQIEALKKGLRVINPTAPASASCLVNFLDKGIGLASNRWGVGTDHIINMKLVLNDGEIINTSSRMWSEQCKILAPVLGIDIEGIFHASMGIFGICTEMTIKLYPVPKLDGILILSYKKDNYELTVEFMREVVKEPSVIELFMWQDIYLATGVGSSNEEALKVLELFRSISPQTEFGDALIICFGGNNEREFEFNKKRLINICNKFIEKYGENNIMLSDEKMIQFFNKILNMPLALRIIIESVRIQRIRGSFFINWFNTKLDHCGKIVKEFKRITTKNLRSLVPEHRISIKKFPDDLVTVYIQPLEFARSVMLECDFFPDQADPENIKKSLTNAKEVIEMTLKNGGFYDRPYGGINSGFGATQTPRLGTYYELLKELKQLLDPNNILNPGRLALPIN
ncbi:MAG: FAD-binding oxidoreductase [Candidatus Helarchaeota archaeon]